MCSPWMRHRVHASGHYNILTDSGLHYLRFTIRTREYSVLTRVRWMFGGTWKSVHAQYVYGYVHSSRSLGGITAEYEP